MIMSLNITSCSFVEPINPTKSIKEIQATTPILKSSLDNIVKNMLDQKECSLTLVVKLFMIIK